VLVGVIGGPCRPLRAGAETEAALVGLEPRRAAPAAVTEPIDERALDREDPLLPGWRHRRDAARLGDQRVVQRAEVDLDRTDVELQGFADAAQRDAGSAGATRGHQAAACTRRPGPDWRGDEHGDRSDERAPLASIDALIR
jgi:hypothetical protein